MHFVYSYLSYTPTLFLVLNIFCTNHFKKLYVVLFSLEMYFKD